MDSYTKKDGTIITAAEVIERFKALEPKDIEIDDIKVSSEEFLTVTFEWDEFFDMILTFSTVINHPDEWSVLYKDFKFSKCTLDSQYASELSEETGLVIEEITTLVEDFMVSDEYKVRGEVFFDLDSLEKSKDREAECENPMKAYGFRTSDFL